MSDAKDINKIIEEEAIEMSKNLNIDQSVCDYLEKKYNTKSQLFKAKVLDKYTDIVIRMLTRKKENDNG